MTKEGEATSDQERPDAAPMAAASDVLPEAKPLFNRLAAIDRAHPLLDKVRVERALAEHLKRLELSPLRVRWMPDVLEACRHMWQAAYDAEPRLALASTPLSHEELERVMRHGARHRALAGARERAEKAAMEARRHGDGDIDEEADTGIFASDGWLADEAVEEMMYDTRLNAGLGTPLSNVSNQHSLRNMLWWTEEHARDEALKAAQWVEMAHRTSAKPEAGSERRDRPAIMPDIERYARVLLPLFDACAAGLWSFWVMPGEIIAVPRPLIRMREGRFHCSDGPALAWPEGVHYWFWQGVQVPRHVIEQPETITVEAIDSEENAEIRRVMIERYRHGAELHGTAAYLRDAGAERLDHDAAYGTLWRREMADDEPIVMVELVNATAERDGGFKRYFLRVPPDTKTAREAVAWSFALSGKEYAPEIES